MPQEEDEASATDLRGGEKQRDRDPDPGSVTQSQRHKKIDLGLGLGLGLGFVDYLRNRSLVPKMTRAPRGETPIRYDGERLRRDGREHGHELT